MIASQIASHCERLMSNTCRISCGSEWLAAHQSPGDHETRKCQPAASGALRVCVCRWRADASRVVWLAFGRVAVGAAGGGRGASCGWRRCAGRRWRVDRARTGRWWCARRPPRTPGGPGRAPLSLTSGRTPPAAQRGTRAGGSCDFVDDEGANPALPAYGRAARRIVSWAGGRPCSRRGGPEGVTG
jgi:hypothetical protein